MFNPPRLQVILTIFLKDPGNIQYSLQTTKVLPDSVCSRALWALMSLIMRCCSSSFVLISLSWSSRERHIFSRFACLYEEWKERCLVQLIIYENLKSYERRKNDSEAKISQLTDKYFYEICIPSFNTCIFPAHCRGDEMRWSLNFLQAKPFYDVLIFTNLFST